MSTAPTILTATKRTELEMGKGAARVRRAGRVPAVVFGHGIESLPVSLDAHEFDALRKHLHSNTLIDLRVEGSESRKVMVHGIHIDPRYRRLLHVDLFAFKSGEEVTVDVALVTVGYSHAVDKLDGTLLHNVDHIRVRSLPENLPESIEISIEPLVDFEVAIHVRDLALPEGLTLLSDPDEVVAKVIPPAVAEVVAAAPVEEEAAEAPATEGESSGS
ncbi:MAG TPA: 50S ribosomal protein L25 [Candidatus Limnocylindrales bacterium]